MADDRYRGYCNCKWPYLRNGLADWHEIWHGDAYWPSELCWQLKF